MGGWVLQAGQIAIDQALAKVVSQTLGRANVTLAAVTENGNTGDIDLAPDAVIEKTTGAENSKLIINAQGKVDIQGQIAQWLDAPLTLEVLASEVSVERSALLAVSQLTVQAQNTLNTWGELRGLGEHPLLAIFAGVANVFGTISANNSRGKGGSVRINAGNIYLNARSRIEADGLDGGDVFLAASDSINAQQATIQTNGSNGRGGSIAMSGTQNTLLSATTISAVGLEQGGKILIGNDAKKGTLPFSVYTSLDALTVISAGQINPHGIAGGFIETSGQTLGLLAAINAGRGGMWLLDPTNVTISSAASSGGDLATAQGQATTSNFNTTQIQTAINAGTSVTIIASGTITQTTALTFNITGAGLTPTLTFNNTSGSKQAITLIAMTDNSSGSSSAVSMQAISAGGAIAVNGAINLKGSITLDNTYGGTDGAGGTATSGFITASNVTTLATTAAAGINVTSALTASGLITLNGVSTGATTGNAAVVTSAAIAGAGGVTITAVTGGTNGGLFLNTGTSSIASSAGNISINATALGATNIGFNGSTIATAITATLGSVSITGRAVGGTSVNQSGLITARSITVNGIASGNPATNVSLGAMTIASGGSNISVTATSGTAGANTGIYQSGAITGVSGSSISFTSNNKIDQTGALTLIANTSIAAANITYDTTTGTKASTIAAGNLTISASTSSSAINYTAISAGLISIRA